MALRLFSLPDGVVDSGDRASWLTGPFSASFAITGSELHYVASGGISLGSLVFSPTEVNVTYCIVEDFTWNVLETIEIDFESLWDVGAGVLRYYRVQGRCHAPPTCEASGYNVNDALCADSGLIYLQIIAATSLQDLCTKMHEQGIRWPAARITRYSRPVYLTDANEDPNCNTAEDQVFCHIPECLDYCLDEDLLLEIGSDTYEEHIEQAALEIGGTIYLSGSAVISRSNAYTPSGGIQLGGAAITSSSYFSYIASGGIVLSGTPNIVSVAWNYTGNGGILLSGSAVTSSTAYNYIPDGGIELQGSADEHYGLYYMPYGGLILNSSNISRLSRRNILPSGGVILGGSALITSNRFSYISSGGVVLSGSSFTRSPSWHYTSSGGVAISGSANIGFRTTANGGITLSGSADIIHHFVGTGGIVLGGSVVVESSPTWHYVGSGGIVLGGSSVLKYIGLGELVSEFGSDTELLLMEPDYPVIIDALPIDSAEADVTSNCGCDTIPNKLYMSHNLGLSPILSAFLNRNNYTLPTKINLVYNKFDKSWRANYHYRESTEKWHLVFEWYCDSGEDELSLNLWNFSVLIRRILPNYQLETRILYSFEAAPLCFNDKINFKFKLNTVAMDILEPNDVAYRDAILYDEIGLFDGKVWNKNPNLIINISETGSASAVPTVDIKPIFSS